MQSSPVRLIQRKFSLPLPPPSGQQYRLRNIKWFLKTSKADILYRRGASKELEEGYVKYLEACCDAPQPERYSYPDTDEVRMWRTISAEKIKKASTMKLRYLKRLYTIDFANMTQTNDATSKKRRIGRTGPLPPHMINMFLVESGPATSNTGAPKPPDNRIPVWLWERFRNRFDVYSAEASTLVEQRYTQYLKERATNATISHSLITFRRQGKSYSVHYELDFSNPNKCVQRRDHYGTPRRIFRVLLPRNFKRTTTTTAATPPQIPASTVAKPDVSDAGQSITPARDPVVTRRGKRLRAALPSDTTTTNTATATAAVGDATSDTSSDGATASSVEPTVSDPKLGSPPQGTVDAPLGCVKWQFSNAAGTVWHNFSKTDSDTVEEAFQKFQKAHGGAARQAAAATASFSIGVTDDTAATAAGTSSTDSGADLVKGIRCGRRHYSFDFVNMKQINESNKTTRTIRRHVELPQDNRAQAGDAASSVVHSVEGTIALVKSLLPNMDDAAAVMEEEKRSMRGDKSTYLGRGELDNDLKRKHPTYEVAHTANDGLLMCMLNKADIQKNNNKFYFLQVARDPKDPTKNVVVVRFGRVGTVGQRSTTWFNSIEQATAFFRQQFYSKTKNSWDDRHTFRLLPGSYVLMRIDNRTEEEREAEDGPSAKKSSGDGAGAIKAAPVAEPPSKLPTELKDLMVYLSDRSDMQLMMDDFSMDVKRMPLGRITKEQIKDAFTVLSAIEKEILNPSTKTHKKLIELSNTFYTLLPHKISSQSRLPAIDNPTLLQKKIDLVESLADLELANAIMKKKSDPTAMAENHLDILYKRLNCNLRYLPDSDPVVQRIREYTDTNRGSSHYMLPSVEQVFAVERPGDLERWEELSRQLGSDPAGPFTDRRMLWHGSRKTNFLGILSQGLRIAPPEAPSTGYMFGKGIYFSDVVTKASNYCHPMNNKGLMLLCDVALGPQFLTGKAKYMEQPQPGTFSTLGWGRSFPDPETAQVIDGVKWPLGKVAQHKKPLLKSTDLLYPEFIIYNPAQYRMKYLVKMAFKR